MVDSGPGASESATTRRRLLDKTPDHRLVTVTLAWTRDKARANLGHPRLESTGKAAAARADTLLEMPACGLTQATRPDSESP